MAQGCSYRRKVEGDEITLEIDCSGCPFASSLEDGETCMLLTNDKLAELVGITRISLAGQNVIEYGIEESRMLKELTSLLRSLRSSPLLKKENLCKCDVCHECDGKRAGFISDMLEYLLKDPVGGYVDLKRVIIEESKSRPDKRKDCKECTAAYIDALKYLQAELETLALISKAQPFVVGHKVGDRKIYRQILQRTTRPSFSLTRFYSEFPQGGEMVAEYTLKDKTKVRIFRSKGSVRHTYHITPPELNLEHEEFEAIAFVRGVLATHKPKADMLVDPSSLRSVFFELSRDLLEEYVERVGAENNGKKPELDVNKLASIITRATAGIGVLESVLQDENVQDININAPTTSGSVRLYHGDFEECDTNILPSPEEVLSWSSRLKLISGRPLDQANPVLDTSITLPGVSARVAAVTRPLSPNGLAFSIRRHREMPWTYPLFIKNGMINPLGAALLSFAIDGARTLLIAGTRGSGKTSFLGASMLEVLKKYRVITVEDTLELPVSALSSIGYDILSFKVRSPMSEASGEPTAEEGIRSALRFGDSCLILGEVRSYEAKALYEAMRVGALSNMVAGTIHADSPYGVFDRVVNDLRVPPTSFKATDLIVITNPIRSADGLHRKRRIVKITEVRKAWRDDPIAEGGFVDLMSYDSRKDELVPTEALLKGQSEVLGKIAENVPEWRDDFHALWDNIKMRAAAKEALVKYAEAYNNPHMLESKFSSDANAALHLLVEASMRERGESKPALILEKFKDWVKEEAKGMRK